MHLRAVAVGLLLALPCAGVAEARRCETAEACVAIARKTPASFGGALVPLLQGLSTEALLAGLDVEVTPPALTERVRGLVAGQLHGRSFTDAQLAQLMARYLASEDATADRFRGPLQASPAGQKLLLSHLATHDDARAQRLARSLLLQKSVKGAERARCVVLVWQGYLRVRGKPGAEHDEVMNFVANEPDDFAERARALATVAAANREPLVYDDLDLMVRQPRQPMVMVVAAWAAQGDPMARLALFTALQTAEAAVVEAVRGPSGSGLEGLLVEAMADPRREVRAQAVHAIRRVYPKKDAPQRIASGVIALAADSDPSVRQGAFRILDDWSDDVAARRALVAAVRRFDREAVQHMLVARGPALQAWKATELLFVLRELPAVWWSEPAWQHTIIQAGLALEHSRKQRYGFDAFSAEVAGRCGNDRLPSVNEPELAILDPAAHAAWKAKQPKPPTIEEQARSLAARRDQLRAARDKLLGGKS